MTKAEFLKRYEEEKLKFPNKKLILDQGLVYFNGHACGCTKAAPDSKYYSFYSYEYNQDPRDYYYSPEPTVHFIEYVNDKGIKRKIPIPLGISCNEFETEEEAYDDLYRIIKLEMRTPEEIEADEEKWLIEEWSDPKLYEKKDEEEDE